MKQVTGKRGEDKERRSTKSTAPKKSRSKNTLSKRKNSSKSSRNRKGGSIISKIALVAVLLLAICFSAYKVWMSDAVQTRFVYMWDYQQDIITYSEKNNVDPFLIAAIIKNESGFDHKAVSKVGAVGLMQIMPETGQWIARQMGLKEYQDKDLYTTRTNIRMGCWYVGELDHEFEHNMTLLLTAYNAGRGQTHAWMQQYDWDYNFNDVEKIPFPDTREYVTRVQRDRDKYYLYYKDIVEQKGLLKQKK